ncbi:MAG: hypothetical protein IJJ81_02060 [Ruminococcus sp.]|nr:hypothetical protein [Ruminococcus sp.]
MKKIAAALCALVLLGAGVFTGFRARGTIINGNRYGSMAIVNGELYYYANHYVYKYSSGKSKKVEWADSCHFTVSTEGGNVKINYNDESSSESTDNPYKDILSPGMQYSVVYDDKYVYARYPQGDAKIDVYMISSPSAESGSLKKTDTITF